MYLDRLSALSKQLTEESKLNEIKLEAKNHQALFNNVRKKIEAILTLTTHENQAAQKRNYEILYDELTKLLDEKFINDTKLQTPAITCQLQEWAFTIAVKAEQSKFFWLKGFLHSTALELMKAISQKDDRLLSAFAMCSHSTACAMRDLGDENNMGFVLIIIDSFNNAITHQLALLKNENPKLISEMVNFIITAIDFANYLSSTKPSQKTVALSVCEKNLDELNKKIRTLKIKPEDKLTVDKCVGLLMLEYGFYLYHAQENTRKSREIHQKAILLLLPALVIATKEEILLFIKHIYAAVTVYLKPSNGLELKQAIELFTEAQKLFLEVLPTRQSRTTTEQNELNNLRRVLAGLLITYANSLVKPSESENQIALSKLYEAHSLMKMIESDSDNLIIPLDMQVLLRLRNEYLAIETTDTRALELEIEVKQCVRFKSFKENIPLLKEYSLSCLHLSNFYETQLNFETAQKYLAMAIEHNPAVKFLDSAPHNLELDDKRSLLVLADCYRRHVDYMQCTAESDPFQLVLAKTILNKAMTCFDLIGKSNVITADHLSTLRKCKTALAAIQTKIDLQKMVDFSLAIKDKAAKPKEEKTTPKKRRKKAKKPQQMHEKLDPQIELMRLQHQYHSRLEKVTLLVKMISDPTAKQEEEKIVSKNFSATSCTDVSILKTKIAELDEKIKSLQLKWDAKKSTHTPTVIPTPAQQKSKNKKNNKGKKAAIARKHELLRKQQLEEKKSTEQPKKSDFSSTHSISDTLREQEEQRKLAAEAKANRAAETLAIKQHDAEKRKLREQKEAETSKQHEETEQIRKSIQAKLNSAKPASAFSLLFKKREIIEDVQPSQDLSKTRNFN